MSNSIFKRMLDKVRFVTQKKQISETYFMDERQIPLVTKESSIIEETPIVEEETVSTKEARTVKIKSGGSTWSFNSDIIEPSAMFTKGLPKKGDTLTIKHFQ
tara:strand:- start:262 stop:567 length:306 start_codon:yes stop_codon:yes gene_type:complete